MRLRLLIAIGFSVLFVTVPPSDVVQAGETTIAHYGAVRNLHREVTGAQDLHDSLELAFGTGRIPFDQRHWPTLVNAYVYGKYPVQAISQAIRFGGKTVHPTIPWKLWKSTATYREYIDRTDGRPVFAYGQPRLESVEEQRRADELRRELYVRAGIRRLSLPAATWQLYVNAHAYGGYSGEDVFRSWAYTRASVHPTISKAQWRNTIAYTSSVVFEGAHGWLFSDFDNVIADQQGAVPFSDNTLRTLRDQQQQRTDWLAERDIHYLVVIIPNKETVYGDNLTAPFTVSGGVRRIDQVTTLLRDQSTVPFLDLREPILAARGALPLYYHSDTHWNSYGALVGYEAIIRALRQWDVSLRAWPRTDFTLVTRGIPAGRRDLAIRTGRDTSREKSVAVVPHRDRGARGVATDLQASPGWPEWTSPRATEHPFSWLPRAVVFRDSFTTELIPYLGEHFSRALYVWETNQTSAERNAIITREHPDVVVEIVTERLLTTLLAQR